MAGRSRGSASRTGTVDAMVDRQAGQPDLALLFTSPRLQQGATHQIRTGGIGVHTGQQTFHWGDRRQSQRQRHHLLQGIATGEIAEELGICLLYTSPSPRD